MIRVLIFFGEFVGNEVGGVYSFKGILFVVLIFGENCWWFL